MLTDSLNNSIHTRFGVYSALEWVLPEGKVNFNRARVTQSDL